MPLKLRQLRHAMVLAEYRGFARAANALGISQPALSRSIQSLEQKFGEALFQRTKDGVLPTDIGRSVLLRARELVTLADSLESELLDSPAIGARRLAVGSGPQPAETFVPAAAAAFLENHPRVALRFCVGNWDELIHSVRSRDLDLFIGETSTLGDATDLRIESLPEQALFLVARASHPLAKSESIDLTQVARWPVVVPARVPPRLLDPTLAVIKSAAGDGMTVRPYPACECTSVSFLKRLVESTDAVTILTLSAIADELECGRWRVLGTTSWLRLQYGIVTLSDRPLGRPAERFLALVREEAARATICENRLIERFAPATAEGGLLPA